VLCLQEVRADDDALAEVAAVSGGHRMRISMPIHTNHAQPLLRS
jgi:hypothetical protein